MSTTLKQLLAETFGTQRAAARELGVTGQTVSNWVHYTPTAALKYAETWERKGVDPQVLAAACMAQREVIQSKRDSDAA